MNYRKLLINVKKKKYWNVCVTDFKNCKLVNTNCDDYLIISVDTFLVKLFWMIELT